MKNIDIVKLICRELGKPEELITYVEKYGKGMTEDMQSIRQRSQRALAGFQKLVLQKELRKQSTGI